jgi:hypothetical protein
VGAVARSEGRVTLRRLPVMIRRFSPSARLRIFRCWLEDFMLPLIVLVSSRQDFLIVK